MIVSKPVVSKISMTVSFFMILGLGKSQYIGPVGEWKEK